MSADAEDGVFSSEEEGGHKVETFVLCSFATSCVQSALARSLARRKSCAMATLTCHFSLEVIFLCED